MQYVMEMVPVGVSRITLATLAKVITSAVSWPEEEPPRVMAVKQPWLPASPVAQVPLPGRFDMACQSQELEGWISSCTIRIRCGRGVAERVINERPHSMPGGDV